MQKSQEGHDHHRVGTKETKASGQSDILEELLDLARNQYKLLNSPESLLPPPYLESVLGRTSVLSDVSPRAFQDLARTNQRLFDFARAFKEGDPVPIAVLQELVNDLQRPLDYVLTRAEHRIGERFRPKFLRPRTGKP